MASNITKEQIDFFKHIMSLAEPYPIDELKKHIFLHDTDEERIRRCDATRAKIILLENGINVD